MQVEIVKGENKGKILLYALSTCGWCKRMKKFLADNDISYEYVDVDLCTQEEQKAIREELVSRGGRASYPSVIIDDKILITGYKEDKIRDALEI